MPGIQGSVLGNPFKANVYGLDECLALYKKWLWKKYNERGIIYEEVTRLVNLGKGNTVNLGCWCNRGAKCHVDIVIALLNYLSTDKKDIRNSG